jgi:sodium/potassium-transporting ATPase subunit alpha
MLPAIALGVENGEEGIMKRPPRARDEKLLTPQVLLTAYGLKRRGKEFNQFVESESN